MNKRHFGKTLVHRTRAIKKTPLALAVSLLFAGQVWSNGAWATDYVVSTNLTSGLNLTGNDTLTVNSGASIMTNDQRAVMANGTAILIDNAGTVSGFYYGIDNSSGSGITTLTNSGTVSGGDYGVYNDGTITTLTNTGTISGEFYTGMYNTGTITTLTNSGTVFGGGYGIYSESGGTIATLTNTGTVSGGNMGFTTTAPSPP